ncbi:MAG: sulfatase [Planctomycetota bacterium]
MKSLIGRKSLQVLTLMTFVHLAQFASGAENRLNVLMLVSDDLANRLGCYGDKLVQSPNIDALANKGVRFDKAYCQFPLCNPSRASFLTGLRPDSTKVYENSTQFRKNIPEAVSLPQTFQKAGYYVSRVGKLYHYGVPGGIGTAGLDDPPSWQETINPRGRDKDEEADVINFTAKTGLGSAISWLKTGGDGMDHTDGKVADGVIGMIEKAKEKPFFIAGGFYRPHVPCIAAEPFFKIYDGQAFPIPSAKPVGLEQVPPVAFFIKTPNYGLTDADLSTFTKAYYASISQMDFHVGRVLRRLEELNLADRTVVVFASDHGYLLGEHGGQWMKMSLFEQSARVPLVIYAPGRKGNGKASSRTVELVDLHATLAELCNVPAPKTDGESLVPLLDDPQKAWDHPAYTQVTRTVNDRNMPAVKKKESSAREIMGRSVRTEQFRYTEWDNGKAGVELYDHQSDPGENSNLASDPAFINQRELLKRLLGGI